jgi:hypothetical protein
MKAMSKFQLGVLLGVPVILLTVVIAYAATNKGKYSGERLLSWNEEVASPTP